MTEYNAEAAAATSPAETPAAAQTQTHPTPGETDGHRAAGGALRPSIRDRIAAARPYASEVVDFPLWDVKIEVRSISLGLRNEMLASVIDPETKEADVKRLYPELIIRTSFDPETGERVFSDDDLAFINGLDAGSGDKLAKPALKLSGMTDDAKDEEAGKSSETETSVSAS
ncbi:hypothetical protein [Mycetocola sp.]|uniref:hypothetical protein n=1 Tax=Mycetocola sp. TaxID=1871042 RepID=UPI003989BA42